MKFLQEEDDGDSKEEEEKDESEKEEKKSEKSDKPKKEKKKIKLDMHLDQVFLDSNDAYVWIYDPVPLYYWFVGSLVVLGTIGVCLFPLWPPMVRQVEENPLIAAYLLKQQLKTCMV